MKGKLHVIAGILFALALFYDLFVWGGLARTDRLGPAVVEATQREVSLAGFYVPAGRALVGVTGLADAARDSAQGTFASREDSLLKNPAALMDNLLSDLPFAVKAGYYGAPLLLLVLAVLWWRRPRSVHMIGPR
jgi:hypothetical protein